MPELARYGREWEDAVTAGLGPDDAAVLRSLLARTAGACAGGGCRHE